MATEIVRERNVKRVSGLTTTEALLVLMMDVYCARKAGRSYSLSDLCERHQVAKFKAELLHEVWPDNELPTIDKARELRQRIRKYEREVYFKKNIPSSPEPEQMSLGLDFGIDLSCEIVVWRGHRYQITRLD